MSRGAQTVTDGPFRTWVVTVDENNRVRIPLGEISKVVPWFSQPAEKLLEYVAVPGPAGGIQIKLLTDHQREFARFDDSLRDVEPEASESNQAWVDAARLLATACGISISLEASRISITLPEPLRRAQQVPHSGGTVVVFGFGNILEIWDAIKWHDHVRGMAKRRAATISDAIEHLGQR